MHSFEKYGSGGLLAANDNGSSPPEPPDSKTARRTQIMDDIEEGVRAAGRETDGSGQY